MHGYVVSRPVVLRTATQVKHIAASADLDKVDVAHVQINALNEHKMVRESLIRQFPEAPVDTLVKTVPYEQLAMWSQFPMLLGRRVGDSPRVGNVLGAQLQALRARHPQRQRFRILLNNGFGTNLGDTLIGMTAFRSVWALLKAHLPQVTVDVLMGWAPLGGVTHLLQQHEGIEKVLHQGPSLQAMGRYQGLIDFSGLILLAGYGEMPPVDWYLWWMGLDPAEVPASDKRNRIALDPEDSAAVAASLSAFEGPKILINPKASESLRKMPDAFLKTLADAVLESDPAVRVVFDQPVAFEHPRAIHLPDVINSPQRLAALVAQVQGIVTPDTFAQHVADATGTPTCTLSASVPADFFRYYPTVQTLVLPGAEQLGGWRKTKVSADQWQELGPAYAQAWARLEPATVLDALKQARMNRAAMPADRVLRVDSPRSAVRPRLVSKTEANGVSLQPLGQGEDGIGDALQRQLLKLGGQILLPGDTVVFLGAGTGGLAAALAARITPYGRLIAFEPRRLIHQVLCANLLLAGLEHVETHPVMPTGPRLSVIPMPRLAVRDDHVSTELSNQPLREPVVHWPVDSLDLAACRLIVLRTPIPLLQALQGAAGTVERHRPFIVAGLLRPEDMEAWQRALPDANYIVRTYRLKDLDDALASRPDDGSLILIAEPRKTLLSGEKT